MATAQATAGPLRVWLQVMDSCKQAIPGANFAVFNPDGSTVDIGPSSGNKRATVSSGSCPLQRGNCQKVTTGCLSWLVTPPAYGSATYHIAERATWVPSDGFYENPPGKTSFTGF